MKSELILSLFGYSPFARVLSPDTTDSPFLKFEHLERVTLTTQPQERQVWGPEGHADIVNEVHGGCPFDTVHEVLHIKF